MRLCLFCSAQPSSSYTTPSSHDHNFTTSNKFPNCIELHLQKTIPIEGLFLQISDYNSTTRISKIQMKSTNSSNFSIENFSHLLFTSIKFQGEKIWNSISPHIRNQSFNTFKLNIKIQLLNSYI